MEEHGFEIINDKVKIPNVKNVLNSHERVKEQCEKELRINDKMSFNEYLKFLQAITSIENVVSIILMNKIGNIPENIGSLINLQTLNLGYNELTSD